MKKIDLGKTVTIFANIGVLVGIFLLVYELNQNRQMMQAQTRSAIADSLVDILFSRAGNEKLAEIQAKLDEGEILTAAETIQLRDMLAAIWRYRENVYYQYRNSLYEEEEYLSQRETWRRFLSEDEFLHNDWCRRGGNTYSPEFVAEIRELLERPCE